MDTLLMCIGLLVMQAGRNDDGDAIDIVFGKDQVAQLLVDRPELGPVLNKHPEIRDWLEKRFAGEAGRKVCWNSEEPKSGSSECMPNKEPKLAEVFVSSSFKEHSPNDKLAMLVFELHNVMMPHIDLSYRLVDRKVSRADFVLAGAKLEHKALVATKKFLKTTSFSKASLLFDRKARFILSAEEDFLKFIEAYRTHDGTLAPENPLTFWESYYDSVRKRRN